MTRDLRWAFCLTFCQQAPSFASLSPFHPQALSTPVSNSHVSTQRVPQDKQGLDDPCRGSGVPQLGEGGCMSPSCNWLGLRPFSYLRVFRVLGFFSSKSRNKFSPRVLVSKPLGSSYSHYNIHRSPKYPIGPCPNRSSERPPDCPSHSSASERHYIRPVRPSLANFTTLFDPLCLVTHLIHVILENVNAVLALSL